MMSDTATAIATSGVVIMQARGKSSELLSIGIIGLFLKVKVVALMPDPLPLLQKVL